MKASVLMAAVALMLLFCPTRGIAQQPEITTDAAVLSAQKLLASVLVEVKVEVIEDEAARFEERLPSETMFDELVQQRIPMRLVGVRIDDKGTVLARDPNLHLKCYGKIEIVGPDGKAVPARIAGVLEGYAGILFAPAEPPAEALPHLTFGEANLPPAEPFLVAIPVFEEANIALRVEPAYAAGTVVPYPQSPMQVTGLQMAYRASCSVILDRRATAIGIALDSTLWKTEKGTDSWVGSRIMADKRLTQETLNETGKKLSASNAIQEVVVTFRSNASLPRLPLEENKLYLYGVLVDDTGRIFVPTDVDRNVIRQIEKISVRSGDKLVDAEFLGLYRTVGAFLIQAKGLSATAATFAMPDAMMRGKVFYTIRARRLYGKRSDSVEYNRFLNEAQGYKEARWPFPEKSLHIGEVLADEEGRLIGFYSMARPDEEERIRERVERPSSGQADRPRVFLFSEIQPLLANPKDSMQAGARPMTSKEQHGLVWLGVEFQPISAALAKSLNAEGPTRNGARGLLVTTVYTGSPADRLGIKPRDILLSINVVGTPGQINLVPQDTKRTPEEARRLWQPRRNVLTETLTLIGEGRQIRLTTLRNGTENVLSLTLEKAPDDFDSADEYKSEVLGLTVKPMTYEVRNVLQWPADAPGVVISAVETGQKASVAQIRATELILRVDNEPVKTTQDFERLVNAAVPHGKVELLVTFLGQSRIVEIVLGDKQKTD